MNPFITVFTPAYNRAHTIGRTYDSLLSQSNKNFVWLIVDDGSSDNTKQLVDEWMQNDNGFEIKYVYKNNGGMHTAHNVAYSIIDTELNVCIDSDDKLAKNAIQIIQDKWSKIKSQNYAGIIGLDADFDNNIIGTTFNREENTTLSAFYANGGKGDKKIVYRTDIMKSIPAYPEFEKEKLVPLSYKYLICDQSYELYAINDVLCNVEYQADGSTNNIYKQYFQSPKGFAEFRKLRMKYPLSKKSCIKDCIHYISSSIIAKDRDFIKKSPKKTLTIICTPFGCLLYSLLKFSIRKG